MIIEKFTDKEVAGILAALLLATKAHQGQKRHGGEPFILHPVRVAAKLNTPDEIMVALLHDVLEDTPTPAPEIERFGQTVSDAVKALTRGWDDKIYGMRHTLRLSDESYFDYIRRVKLNPLAVKVKLADIEHNSGDLKNLPSEGVAKGMANRYAKAILILTEA